MSKKKNTLRDLDEFLKQQAATLVTPEPVQKETPAASTTAEPAEATMSIVPEEEAVTTDKIFDDLLRLYAQDPESFRQKLYALIVLITEAQPKLLPEDKMLINTALYLKSGDQWREALREYWMKKSG